jgi:hypothetical protein
MRGESDAYQGRSRLPLTVESIIRVSIVSVSAVINREMS